MDRYYTLTIEIRGRAADAAGEEAEVDTTTHDVVLTEHDPRNDATLEAFEGKATFDHGKLLELEPRPDAYGNELARQLLCSDAGEPNDRVAQRFLQAEESAKDGFFRIVLSIHHSAAELWAHRWELLRHPHTRVPLGTSERVGLCRVVHSDDRRRVQRIDRTELTALVAVSAPDPEKLGNMGLAPVDYDGEVERARDALGEVPVTTRGGPDDPLTLDRLIEEIRRGADIVYLVCHGKFGRSGTPALILQDEDGAPKAVMVGEQGDRPDLATRIKALAQPPRLFVLASCQSAGDAGLIAAGQRTVQETLAGRLVDAGVPAVIGMQGLISMGTVEAMMPVLFSELLEHGQIDRALAVARGQDAVRERSDWWMPVLYTRLKDGVLWSRPEPGEHAPGDDADAAAEDGQPAPPGEAPIRPPPPDDRPPPQDEPLGRPGRHRPWRWLVLGSIVLAMIAAGAWKYWIYKTQPKTCIEQLRVKKEHHEQGIGTTLEAFFRADGQLSANEQTLDSSEYRKLDAADIEALGLCYAARGEPPTWKFPIVVRDPDGAEVPNAELRLQGDRGPIDHSCDVHGICSAVELPLGKPFVVSVSHRRYLSRTTSFDAAGLGAADGSLTVQIGRALSNLEFAINGLPLGLERTVDIIAKPNDVHRRSDLCAGPSQSRCDRVEPNSRGVYSIDLDAQSLQSLEIFHSSTAGQVSLARWDTSAALATAFSSRQTLDFPEPEPEPEPDSPPDTDADTDPPDSDPPKHSDPPPRKKPLAEECIETSKTKPTIKAALSGGTPRAKLKTACSGSSKITVTYTKNSKAAKAGGTTLVTLSQEPCSGGSFEVVCPD